MLMLAVRRPLMPAGPGYGLAHDPQPRRDLDLASHGLVRLLPGGPPAGYQGLGRAPKLAFQALADLS